MRFFVLCAFFTLAAASKTHFLPVTTSSQLLLLNNNPLVQAPPVTEYREQDSKGFYSYGYKGDSSAKAEYSTTDGSSKGFYSYVDSDGKLQTVKYEAGRNQGFQATATNLPTAPMDTNRPPEPVKDTPEVELAKQAHFEAYREAALKAALHPDTGAELNEGNDYNLAGEQPQSRLNVELQQNTRDLLINHLTNRRPLALLREETRPALLTSSSYESLRLPSSSYHYHVSQPSAQYTVGSPTVLTTLPRIESIHLTNQQPLPLSVGSSYLTQRLSDKSVV
uniref:Cuticle protein 6 n=1 Tax=Glossina austeni TaxID=7395 RepID=A0A1A9VIT3_GLOAU